MMEERWERIVIREIRFYREWPQYKAEIDLLLKENEYNIRYPRTIYENGEIRMKGEDVESQVIDRMAREHKLTAALKKAQERIERLLRNMAKLPDKQLDLLYYLELEPNIMAPKVLKEFYGFPDWMAMYQAKNEAVCDLYTIYTEERKQQEEDYRRMLMEERLAIRNRIQEQDRARRDGDYYGDLGETKEIC